jgi:hypothetical protein
LTQDIVKNIANIAHNKKPSVILTTGPATPFFEPNLAHAATGSIKSATPESKPRETVTSVSQRNVRTKSVSMMLEKIFKDPESSESRYVVEEPAKVAKPKVANAQNL